MWKQLDIKLTPRNRGMHLIGSDLNEVISAVEKIRSGLVNLFLCHTSASLTLNENADPDVRLDMEMAINRIVPEDFPYQHTAEGPDDMPAHIKSSLFGPSITIPIRDGRLALGTWQGIYLCEHRDHGGSRRLLVTINGE